MSLMNDALRKKNREQSKQSAEAGLADGPPRRLQNRTWMTLIGTVVVLTTALAGIYLMQPGSGGSLQIKPLAVAAPLPAVNQTVDSLPTNAGESASTVHPTPQKDPAASQSTTDGAAYAILAPSDASVASRTKTGDRTPPAGSDAPTITNLAPTATSAPESSASHADGEQLNGIHTAAIARSYEPGPRPSIQVEKNEKRVSHPPPAAEQARPSPRTPMPTVMVEKPKADSLAQQTTESAPDMGLFYKKALAYHRRGRLTDAIRFYQQVLKSNSDHQGAMLNLTAIYIERGNYFDAQSLLDRLAQSKPRPKGVLLNLAIAAIGTGNPEKALDYLDSATAVSDASPWEIRFHRAVALARMNRLEQAMTLYDEAALERPDDSRLRFNLAVTCDALGRYPEALAHYERYVRLASLAPETAPDSVNQRIRTLRRYLDRAVPSTINSLAVKG